MHYKQFSVAVALSLAAATIAVADDDLGDPTKLPPAATKTGVTYDNDIKPILDASCIKCHKGDKAKGGIHLDSRDGVIKGGKDGPIVTVGNSAKSQMVFSVAHVGDSDDFMPPPKEKSKIDPLTKEQVGLIRAWIDQGAK